MDTMTCGKRMRLYTRFNKDYHYILTVIDMLNKHGPNCSKPRAGTKWRRQLQRWFETMEDVRKITDIGKKFYNSDVQKFLKKHINYYSTYSVMKASVVKRFNHTLKKCGNNLRTMKITNGHPAASRIKLQRAQVSNYYTFRDISDRRQALNHGSRKDCSTRAI